MFFVNILRDKIFISWYVALFFAQACKLFLYKLFNWNKTIFENKNSLSCWLLIPGGMPSSHTAGMMAGVTALGFRLNVFNNISQAINPVFTIALIIGIYFFNDAIVSRQSIGHNAKAINEIKNLIEEINEGDFDMKEVRELSGHNFYQAVAGVIVGLMVAVIIEIVDKIV